MGAVQLRGVSLGFGGVVLLRDWSADFPPGLTLLVGDDGAGKTSVLRLLAGQLAPQAGSVRWQGAEMAQAPAALRAQVFWRDTREDWPEITPLQWGAQCAGQHAGWSEPQWQAHLQGFGLVEHQDKEMFRLSTGSRRKALLAAALASGAALTLIDEPQAALDKASVRYLAQALAASAQLQSQRIVVVAHYDQWAGVPWGQQLVLPGAE